MTLQTPTTNKNILCTHNSVHFTHYYTNPKPYIVIW